MVKKKTKLVAASKVFRKSKATKKLPSKRLVARRKKNTKKGYFPNPKRKVVRRKNPRTSVKFKYRIYQISKGVNTLACACESKEKADLIADILDAHASGNAKFIVMDYGPQED